MPTTAQISPLDAIFIIIIVVMSIVIHEVSHGYAAYIQGDTTAERAGRLTLNPLSHLDFIGSFIVPLVTFLLVGIPFGWAKPVPFNPYNLRNQRWGEAIVAAAGPASNFLIAIFFAILIRIASANGAVGHAFVSVSALVVLINISLGLFNLVPIPPLDGSKLLFSIIPFHYNQQFRRAYERYSLIILVVFIFAFSYILSPVINFIFVHLTGLY
jgi:Zn-dependent protease